MVAPGVKPPVTHTNLPPKLNLLIYIYRSNLSKISPNEETQTGGQREREGREREREREREVGAWIYIYMYYILYILYILYIYYIYIIYISMERWIDLRGS